ncbi:MAG: hypothetical protein NZ455_12680 [Bacteroidia bacterium]|nr:hypothetical protein [Bacteroidia bacterium]
MREACGGRAVARCEAPRPRFYSCLGGGAQHRSDSVARSTPTRAQRGTRPKNHQKTKI